MEKSKRYVVKKVAAAALAVLLVMMGFVLRSRTADAAEEKVGEIVYDNTFKMADYWSADGAKTAPVKEGYVFGGWYQKTDTGFAALKAIAEDAYAKFVPAYVLSVKSQIEKSAEDGTAASTFLRLVTTVDSTEYRNIGFDIWLNNTKQLENLPVITKVYSSLNNDEGSIVPGTEFGQASAKFAVLKLTQIASVNYQKIIYVRPYWTTLDGTRAEGLARYIRVEDGFTANHYISVPINLLEGKTIAAGILELSYAEYKDVLEVAVDDKGKYKIDAGRVLPEMEYYVDIATGTIKIIGNAVNVDEYKQAESMYASVRFRVKDGVNEEELPDSFTFTIKEGSFCDWQDEFVDEVKAWDYQY